MTLDGASFLVFVLVLTVAAFIAGAAWLPRTRRSVRGFLARLATQLGVSLMVLLLFGVVLNDQNGWYSDWGDLFGSNSQSVNQANGGATADKALTAKPKGHGLDAPPSQHLPALPAPGQRVQTLRFTGSRSGLTGRVMVSLPRGYEDPANATRTYPVIEAFHGYPGRPEVWMHGVNLVPSIDELSSRHTIGDAVVVAPQLEFPSGTDTECVNGHRGQPQVETWVATDVPNMVASRFRVRRDRRSWAALGFSSGGWCAAMAVMLHPDVFGAGILLGGYNQPIFGNGYRPFRRRDPAAERYNLISLVESSPPPVALWLQTSRADGLSYSSSKALLKAAHAPLAITSLVELNAGHRMSVWSDVVPEALAWLGATSPGFKAGQQT